MFTGIWVRSITPMVNSTKMATAHTETSHALTGQPDFWQKMERRCPMASVAITTTHQTPSLLHLTTGSTAKEWKLARRMKFIGLTLLLEHVAR